MPQPLSDRHLRQRHRVSLPRALHSLAIDTFFCDPYAPWQKGGVENAISVRAALSLQNRLCDVSNSRFRSLLAAYNHPRKCPTTKPRRGLSPKRCTSSVIHLPAFAGTTQRRPNQPRPVPRHRIDKAVAGVGMARCAAPARRSRNDPVSSNHPAGPGRTSRSSVPALAGTAAAATAVAPGFSGLPRPAPPDFGET